MKAMEILWIMIIFNFVIWMFSFSGIGVGILSPVSPEDKSADLLAGLDFTTFMLGLSVVTFIISLATRQESVHTILFGVGFAGIFWTTYVKTSAIFISILSSFPYGLMFWTLVSAIVGIVFIIGFVQMSTGGWKFYD